MWKPLDTAFKNTVADKRTTAPVRAKVHGILKKIQSYKFLCLVCCYLDVLELITPASKIFEDGELMPHEVKPTITQAWRGKARDRSRAPPHAPKMFLGEQ